MIRLTLRLPEQLNNLLEKSARENERSKNAQILYILRLFLLNHQDLNEIREFLIDAIAVMDEKGRSNLEDNSYMLWKGDWEKVRKSIFKSLELMK